MSGEGIEVKGNAEEDAEDKGRSSCRGALRLPAPPRRPGHGRSSRRCGRLGHSCVPARPRGGGGAASYPGQSLFARLSPREPAPVPLSAPSAQHGEAGVQHGHTGGLWSTAGEALRVRGLLFHYSIGLVSCLDSFPPVRGAPPPGKAPPGRGVTPSCVRGKGRSREKRERGGRCSRLAPGGGAPASGFRAERSGAGRGAGTCARTVAWTPPARASSRAATRDMVMAREAKCWARLAREGSPLRVHPKIRKERCCLASPYYFPSPVTSFHSRIPPPDYYRPSKPNRAMSHLDVSLQ